MLKRRLWWAERKTKIWFDGFKTALNERDKMMQWARIMSS
jgi:hypothetical protein